MYVVDDDLSVRKALDRLLRAAGHGVKTFSSALEFLDYKPVDAPACLVLDIRMPAFNGLDLQEHLAKREDSLPIVFITGHGTVPMSVRAMKAGAVDFLQKPFGDTDLLSVVWQAIEKDRESRRHRKEIRDLRQTLATLTPREKSKSLHTASRACLNKQSPSRRWHRRKNHQGTPRKGQAKWRRIRRRPVRFAESWYPSTPGQPQASPLIALRPHPP